MTTMWRKPDSVASLPAGHALLEASAGTGKTYAIEHLVIELLLVDGLRIGQLLVVTFTRKAAAELTERIRGRIAAMLGTSPPPSGQVGGAAWSLDEVACSRLEAALRDFDHAQMSTIHAFCQRVLDESDVLTGRLRSDGRVATRTLLRDALRWVMRRVLAAPEPSKDASSAEGKAADEAFETRAMLEEIVRVGKSVETLESWFLAARDETSPLGDGQGFALSTRLRPGYDPAAVVRARAALEAVVSRWPGDLAATAKADGITHAGSLKTLVGKLSRLPPLLRETQTLRPSAFQVRFLHWFKEMVDDKPFENRHSHRGWTRELLLALDAQYSAVQTTEALALHRLLPDVSARYEAEVVRTGATDHDRLLRDTHRAVTDDATGPALVQRLRSRYRAVLVDEFQDTDDLQWELLRRVFIEETGGRLIAVGDPKQAIYRFRGGDIETYFEAKADPSVAVAPALTGNRRSTRAMVDAYNALIALPDVIGGSGLLGDGDVRYDAPVTCQRTGGGLFAPGSAVPLPPMSVMRFEPAPDKHVVALRLHREAIASEVAGMITQGYEVEVAGRRRRLLASDVMCLTFTNNEARGLVAALQRRGVPAALYREEGLWQSDEAGDLLDLLAALADPEDKTLRLKALRTPFFDVALEELDRVDSLPASDRRMRTWHRWTTLGRDRRWLELFSSLRTSTGLRRRTAFFNEDGRSEANFEALLDIAHRAARETGHDLRALLGSLRRRREDEDAASDDDDLFPLADDKPAVRVLTVFKAKGLEAPIVHLHGGLCAAGGPPKPLKVFHEDRARLLWAGTPDAATKAVIKREEELEERRLDYVALTRAADRLSTAVFPTLNAKGDPLLNISGRIRHLHDRFLLRPGHPTLDAAIEERVVDGLPTRPAPTPALVQLPDLAPVATGLETSAKASVKAFEDLRRAHRGWRLASFSGLKPAFGAPPEPPAVGAAKEEEIPRGAGPGKFLHALIEEVPLSSVRAGQGLAQWLAAPAVALLFETSWRRSRWSEAQKRHAERLVHAALHLPVTLSGGGRIEAIGALPTLQRELPFHIPFPSGAQPVLGTPVDGAWRIEHGFLKGAIDFAFTHEGRIWFGDWKTNALEAYGPDTVERSVAAAYEGQVRIYTLALMRLCGIVTEADYEQRFGGAVYVYLRGFDGVGGGLHVARPTWAQMQELDGWLRDKAAAGVHEEDERSEVEERIDVQAPVSAGETMPDDAGPEDEE